MARFGTWAPLASNWASQPRMSQVDIISIHTMVGSLAGTDAYFRRNGFGGTFSHFGIGGNGECTQWQDTAYRAAANYLGNWHIISVECADIGAPFPAWNTADGSAVPAFSPAQMTTLANLIRTIAPAHNIPIVLIPDAKVGRRGIGYHRQGVPGYMVPGAEQWSTAQGKVCPGNRRIAQIPQIIQMANGADDMPLSDDDLRKVYQAVWFGIAGAQLIPNLRRDPTGKVGEWPFTTLGAMDGRIQNEILPAALQPIKDALAKAGPAVSVDAASVANSLAGNQQFLDSLADALAAKLGARLTNG
jgi:hypothetical protein